MVCFLEVSTQTKIENIMLWLQTPDPAAIARADSVKADFTQQIENLARMPFDDLVDTLIKGLISFGLKLLAALALFYGGRWLIRRIKKVMTKVMTRRDVDVTLQSFLNSFVGITLTLFLVIIIIGVLGVNTSSFIALFASAGVAIGLALSGTLQNFAGGVMILLFRPFRIGDYIETQSQAGTVESIQLFHTVLKTPDNKTIMVPNGPISTGIVNNYSREKTRRIEWAFGVAYGSDYDKAKKAIVDLIEQDTRIQKDPPPYVALTALADNSVNIIVRAWTDSDEYWDVYFDMNERVYKAFTEIKITNPYGQMNIRVLQSAEIEQES